MPHDVVPGREEQRRAEGEEEADGAGVVRAVPLARQREPTHDDQHRADEERCSKRLPEHDERDRHGDERGSPDDD